MPNISATLLHTIDRIKPEMKPLALHFAASQDTHTCELYATMLAAVLLSGGQISDAESRLFAMLLQSLRLESKSAKFFTQAQKLSTKKLRDFFRILETDDLKSAFLMDAMILARIDSPISEEQSQLLAEFIDVFELDSSKLDLIVGIVSVVIGLPCDHRKTAQPVKFKTPKNLTNLNYDAAVYVVSGKPCQFVDLKYQLFTVRAKKPRTRGFSAFVGGMEGKEFSIKNTIKGVLLDLQVKSGDVLSDDQIIAYVLPIPLYAAAWSEFFSKKETTSQTGSPKEKQPKINKPASSGNKSNDK